MENMIYYGIQYLVVDFVLQLCVVNIFIQFLQVGICMNLLSKMENMISDVKFISNVSLGEFNIRTLGFSVFGLST